VIRQIRLEAKLCKLKQMFSVLYSTPQLGIKQAMFIKNRGQMCVEAKSAASVFLLILTQQLQPLG
jgi:hypothetical protein